MKAPLEGITILDLTQQMQGPWATVLLSDMGADVIKVEDPVRGDGSRNYHIKDPKDYGGIIAFYETLNRNKRSMTLDLKKPEGREVFYRLVKDADVVTSNFLVGVVERLGVDSQTLVKHNPRIITATATGWGKAGPDAGAPCLDIMGQARSGFAHLMANSAGLMFHAGVYGLLDCVGAMMFAYAIAIAIANRERDGVGQDVEISQFGSALLLQAFPLGAHLIHGETPPPLREANTNPMYSMYECADGKWIAFAGGQFEKNWPGFSRALGIEDLINQPGFQRQGRGAAFTTEMMEAVRRVFRTRPSGEWLRVLRENGVFGVPVQTYDDLLQDPQVLANEYITEVQHPSGVRLKEIGVPFKFSRTPGRIKSAAPQYGEHTEEVLLAHGYTWEEIEALRARGAI